MCSEQIMYKHIRCLETVLLRPELLAVIVQCDGMWQKIFPASVPSTAELEQPVREGALLSDHCVMERVLIIVNDG